MPAVSLPHRSIVSVGGAEAEHFLNNLVTTELAALDAGTLKPGALLTPQGKILFDFLISRDGAGGFRLDCLAASAGDLARRLKLYKLRAKVEISVHDEAAATVSWDDDSSAEGGLRDSRFPGIPVWRRYGGPEGQDPLSAWTALRIAEGVAEAGIDYAEGDAFPHDAGFDQNGGVSFRKGCFVGQEVVSRMQHRGTARRRLLVVSADAPLPASGTEIEAGGKPVGTLGSVDGSSGLAMARIDRVKAAMDAGTPITAGDAMLTLALPPHVAYRFPATNEDTQADG